MSKPIVQRFSQFQFRKDTFIRKNHALLPKLCIHGASLKLILTEFQTATFSIVCGI